MNLNPFLMSISLIVAAGPLAGNARAATGPQGIRFLPDVAAQFDALRPELDPVGWHMVGMPDPSFCRHLQALVRVEAPDGTPYFLVTRSGNRPDAVKDIPFDGGCIDGDGENGQGHLIVVRMGERDKNGERLRSNRLSKLDFIEQTQPTPGDKGVIFYTVTEDGLVLGNGPNGVPPRTFSHPGGMQVVGHTLALAMEAPCQNSLTIPAAFCEPTTVDTMIHFYDVTDPEHPVLTSRFSPQPVMGKKAGVVGITPLPGGRNLLVSAGGDAEQFFFFRSNAVDLSSPDLQWELVNSTPGPNVKDAHQTLTFLRQGDINGPLFIAAARGFALSETIISPAHRDFIDLYSVACNPADCAPGATITLGDVVSNKFMANGIPSSFGSRQVNLAAASAFYVSPSGELIFYATEHDNDGPGGTVKAGEYPHRDVVRDDSLTLLPNADIDKESYEVEEGDSVTLSGRGRPPKTRAFIQVFQETGFRDFCTVIDFDDVDLDDFDNLGRFCLYGPEGGIRSWIWYAPEGCTIRATHTQLGGVKTLKGTGHIERDFDLAQVRNDLNTSDMDLRVDKIQFGSDCDAYYDTGADLEWDLNLDGTFETTGDEVTFNSRGFDGPSVVNVPVQARHPGSTVPGPGFAQVVVRNLQPVIQDIVVTDGAGNVVNTAIPFVLVGLPVTLRFTFSDPGTPDHQTASVAWGDGVTDPNTSFVSFKDAFGGVIGEGVARHVYRSAAQFEMLISVADDDGGVERDGTQIKVVTVAQGLDAAIVLLDDLIAHTTDPAQRKILEKVAKALYGNPRGSNGAQLMLRTGNKSAAIAFLNTAIGLLQDASTRGAQTGTIPAILKLLVAALNAGA
jgi:hypothetical protein